MIYLLILLINKMNEIKIINVELKSKRYSECQICHNYETEYNLNCELS